MKHKFLVLSLLVLLVSGLTASFASGPVYDELPDLEGREVVVAVENFYTPYQFTDPRAEGAIGFEYDVVNEVCRRINCTPVYETTTFEFQLSGVQSGEYDMAMNGLFITEERQEIYDFSVPYSQAEAFLLVRADYEPPFANLEELAAMAADEDIVFGVQNNSFGQALAAPDWFAVPEDKVVTYNDFTALLTALANGDVDAMVVDAFAGAFVHAQADQFKLVGEPVVDPAPMGLLFQKGSDLVEPFNAALESMTADGYLAYLNYKWAVDFQPVTE